MTDPTVDQLTSLLIRCAQEVRRNLGEETVVPIAPAASFRDLLDSMGMVEFLLLVARECGTTPEALEKCAGHRFGTVADLAAVMHAAGFATMQPPPAIEPIATRVFDAPAETASLWLAAVSVCLPAQTQSAGDINRALNRPSGWLEEHAGIVQRHIWGEQVALGAAADAGRRCLARAGIELESVGALLVTSEAPPLLAGLAAALHHRLALPSRTVALEVGGACAGFVAALWLAQSLVPRAGSVLILSVEAPSRYLHLKPGPAGEAAALFGDAAAACVVTAHATGNGAVPLLDVRYGCDGGAAAMIQVERSLEGTVEVRLEGEALAQRALRSMARSVGDLTRDHGLTPGDLAAVVIHGGNGRFPQMLARQLDLPPERVCSETARTGNLGSASLPAAWAAHASAPTGPAVWTAVGAGLTWGAALTGPSVGRS